MTVVMPRTAPAVKREATEGYGAMPSYEAQISARDRWAIVAFIRALQLSQHTAAADLSPDERQKLSQPEPKADGAGGEHKQ